MEELQFDVSAKTARLNEQVLRNGILIIFNN